MNFSNRGFTAAILAVGLIGGACTTQSDVNKTIDAKVGSATSDAINERVDKAKAELRTEMDAKFQSYRSEANSAVAANTKSITELDARVSALRRDFTVSSRSYEKRITDLGKIVTSSSSDYPSSLSIAEPSKYQLNKSKIWFEIRDGAYYLMVEPRLVREDNEAHLLNVRMRLYTRNSTAPSRIIDNLPLNNVFPLRLTGEEYIALNPSREQPNYGRCTVELEIQKNNSSMLAKYCPVGLQTVVAQEPRAQTYESALPRMPNQDDGIPFRMEHVMRPRVR